MGRLGLGQQAQTERLGLGRPGEWDWDKGVRGGEETEHGWVGDGGEEVRLGRKEKKILCPVEHTSLQSLE